MLESKPNRYKIHFLTLGKHTDSNMNEESYSREDLEEIAESYDPESLYESPIVIGHDEDISKIYENDQAPSYGWVKGIGNDEDGAYGIVDLAPEFAELLERKVPPYKYISAAIYEKDNPFNPTNGKAKYLRHIAFLGAQPPAIKGLPKIKAYADGDNSGKSLKTYTNLFNNCYIEKMGTLPVEEQDTIVNIPDESASPEEIKAFLEGNAKDFLVYILTSGELGYSGEITRFEPEPSAANNYLYDVNEEKFKGSFFDDASPEIDGFEFEIAKAGDGWTSYYIPNNRTEPDEEEEEIYSEAEETETVVEAETVTESELEEETETYSEGVEEESLSVEDESSMAQGELPEIEEEEAEVESVVDGEIDLISEIELMKQEANSLRQEVLRLKTEINEIKMNEFREYCESKASLLEGTSFSKDKLLTLLSYQPNEKPLVKAFSETFNKETPAEVVMSLLDELDNKFKVNSMVTYGETAIVEEDEPAALEEANAPGVAQDPESLKIHKEVLRYCGKTGLDPKNSAQYLKAYKAVINNR